MTWTKGDLISSLHDESGKLLGQIAKDTTGTWGAFDYHAGACKLGNFSDEEDAKTAVEEAQ